MTQHHDPSSPSLGVFIGRFQFYHAGHHHVIVNALDHVQHLLVLVGSANQPRGTVNPFTVQERIEMIRSCLSDQQLSRVSLVGLEDSKDSVQDWVHSVHDHAQVVWGQLHGPTALRATLVGHAKDHSSYYLRLFPGWASLDIHALPGHEGEVLSATGLRQSLLGPPSLWQDLLEKDPGVDKARFIHQAPSHARRFALSWLSSAPPGVLGPTIPLLRGFVLGEHFDDICREAAFAAHFRYAWRHSPYPPIFVTSDPVVFHGDHVLMVRRADYPGRGQWALPGGFVEEDEPLLEACLRELAEETALGMSRDQLASRLFFQKCYDNPRRSVRGRVITHAYGFALDPSTPRPSCQFNDESLGLAWIHIAALRRQECFEDHFSIVHRFHSELCNNRRVAQKAA